LARYQGFFSLGSFALLRAGVSSLSSLERRRDMLGRADEEKDIPSREIRRCFT
jgi:hypothetical protein